MYDFPITVAQGLAFCNRVEERHRLKNFIQSNRHTVIIAPRRYGKTSLIAQSLAEMKIPHTMMEFTLATNAQDVEQLIAHHVSELLFSILPKTQQLKEKILHLFSWLNPRLTITALGQRLEFKPDWQSHSAPQTISDILLNLNNAAKMTNKKMVIVMDEFQQLSLIDHHTIEASIRHAMQYSTHVSYIFSGSHRHLLLDMFNSKKQPFYHSCEIMTIDRIARIDYIPFIQKKAQEKWKKQIASSTLDTLFSITECHPNYINRICGYFWSIDKYPTRESIQQYWKVYVESQASQLTEMILALSANQRRVLAYLAQYPTKTVSNHAFSLAVDLPEASIRQAIRVLLKKDYLQKNNVGVISILDPAMRDFLLASAITNQTL